MCEIFHMSFLCQFVFLLFFYSKFVLNENEVCLFGWCVRACVCGYNLLFLCTPHNIHTHPFYSSSSSLGNGTGAPPLALPDDDDKIGPDNFKSDVRIVPEPPDWTGKPFSFKSAGSLESLSSSDTT